MWAMAKSTLRAGVGIVAGGGVSFIHHVVLFIIIVIIIIINHRVLCSFVFS